MAPEPGWYADPDDASMMRLWDGQRWTDEIKPLAPPPPQGLPVEPLTGVDEKAAFPPPAAGDQPSRSTELASGSVNRGLGGAVITLLISGTLGTAVLLWLAFVPVTSDVDNLVYAFFAVGTLALGVAGLVVRRNRVRPISKPRPRSFTWVLVVFVLITVLGSIGALSLLVLDWGSS